MQINRSHFSSQSGSIMIMVAVAVFVIFAFLILAVDMPMVMLAKSQLQNAADAGALAGAIAFYQTPGSDRSLKITNATADAISIAGLDSAVQNDNRRPVAITAADVTVDDGDTIWVTTHRTHAAGDALTQHFLKLVNPASDNLTDVTAHAAALVSPLCGTDCLKPWCIPDKWRDMPGGTDSVWDAGIDYYDPQITGYTAITDVGTSITLKLSGSNDPFRQGWFFACCFPAANRGDPDDGGDVYRQYIGQCEPYLVRVGDTLMTKSGNMVGPTNQGIANLLALDPLARWDPVTGTIINSAFPTSPRLILVPCFDPRDGLFRCDVCPGGGDKYLEITKIVVVFLEQVQPDKSVLGKFMRMGGEGVPCDSSQNNGGFVYTPALVR